MSGNIKMHPAGAVLSYSTDNITYTNFVDLERVTPSELERAWAAATSLGSPGKTKEGQPSWRDPGKLPFTLWLSQTQYATILGMYNDEVLRYFKITAPLIGSQVQGANWVNTGYVTKVGVPEWAEGEDDLAKVEVEFSFTGPPTFTAGA